MISNTEEYPPSMQDRNEKAWSAYKENIQTTSNIHSKKIIGDIKTGAEIVIW